MIGWLKKLRRPTVQPRSDRHEAMLGALEEWFRVDDILQVAIDQGVLSKKGIQDAQEAMYNVDETSLSVLLSAFLANKQVRRAVANYMRWRYGYSREESLKILRQAAEYGRA